jgi:hypothetical protein
MQGSVIPSWRQRLPQEEKPTDSDPKWLVPAQ